MDNYNYPMGAYTQTHLGTKQTRNLVPCEVDYSCTLRRTATVDVTDYIPGTIEKEWDGEGYVAVRVDDDFSDTNWLENFDDTYHTPLELIDVLRRTAEELLKGNMPDKDPSYWVNIINECKGWTIDDEEAEKHDNS